MKSLWQKLSQIFEWTLPRAEQDWGWKTNHQNPVTEVVTNLQKRIPLNPSSGENNRGWNQERMNPSSGGTGPRLKNKSTKTLWQKLSQIFKHLSSKNLSWIRTGVDKKPTLYHAWLQGPTEHATSRGHKICSAAENPPCFSQKEVTRSMEWAHPLKQPSPR